MANVDTADRVEEVWKAALGFLLLELSADRAVVLLDEESNGEYAPVASRGIDPDALAAGEAVDLAVLRSACRSGGVVAQVDAARGRHVLCVPLQVAGGLVRGVLYADRRQADGPFRFEDLQRAAGFAQEAAARLEALRPAPPAVPAPHPEPAAAVEPPAATPGEPVPSEPVWEHSPTRDPLEAVHVPVPRAPVPEAPRAPVHEPPRAPVHEPPRARRMSRISAPFELQRPTGQGLARTSLVAGRFAVQREFLRCRFSVLLEAVDRTTNAPLVLRRLEADAEGEARRQILAEGRMLGRLRHRNLPRVLEVVEDEGRIYLVLEEFSGQTLAEAVASGPLPPELVRRYCEQMLEALDYLHRQSPAVVHRDLQPETVLVTEHGVLKLAEFGLARMGEGAGGGRTTAYRALGSALYGAPEQLMGEPSHPGNDLYSAGALLYHLAAGQPPPPSIERAMGAAAALPLAEVRPDLEPRVAALVETLMAPDAAARPRSAAEARMQLAWDDEDAPPPAMARPTLVEEEQPLPPEEVAPVLEEAPCEAPAPLASEPAPAPPPVAAPPKPVEPGLMKKAANRFGQAMAAWKVMLGKKPDEAPAEANSVTLHYEEPEIQAPFFDLAQTPLDREGARNLPELVSRSIHGVCVGLPGGSEMMVAVSDPSQVYIYDHVSIATQGRYRATLLKADPAMIDLALEYVYRAGEVGGSIPWLEWLERKKLTAETMEVMNPMADIALGLDEITSPIVAAVDRIIKEAISAGASDIHLETYEQATEVRYRLDGVLHPIDSFPARDASAMVKRLKVMANMDIAQERIPQGGRISLKVGAHELDLRVSIIPVPHGESVVMRLLKKGAFNLTLQDLGFSDRVLDRFQHVLSQPYGMILSCGPTGSGKSTTLYASLKEIQRPDRKLLTVEDPIEYQMPGICQVQVNTAPREEEKKVTFARVLREFLRQDPDVILVGEIRDTETASIAVQAALTGHLLLSTIHTNDSVGIIARLRDMGVEQFLIGSTLLGGLAQRLARRICAGCREETEVPEVARDLFASEGFMEPRLFHGVGCRKCHGTGYRGRVGLYELLEITPEVRALINAGEQEEQIRAAAVAQGFKSLFADGLFKAQNGLVTLEEVQRVCKTL